MNDETRSNRHCAACGAPFYCAGRDGASGCWCAQLPNIMPLSDEHAGCLCPPCLRERIERRTRGAAE
ncbi:MAG TPA: cysteine-rich CWC family protein [Burkholderiales bacterium]|nr:cysteine-rich CWC family protein [Burkholderiales bacterium]